ncbi:hypothetical protein FVR03_09530 [Pontibacter qinzhouensis]|uniref:Uncharacterized protein n=2 Tax=Pontibacter qinzhouensis TaxID=2603253 RepID=A0A5C8K8Y7_9BACT|nr:hypothetical protein FVR03_09530 [Pontibacter qinzhouensis]
MNKGTIQFWLLFIVSIILSVVAISLFFKALKLILYVILVAALAPVIYLVLRLFIGRAKKPDNKLKRRE